MTDRVNIEGPVAANGRPPPSIPAEAGIQYPNGFGTAVRNLRDRVYWFPSFDGMTGEVA